jgi:tetratricopeptide (TPR) repeat protein
MQRAVDLDPVSPIINTNLATAYYFARQNDRAIEQYRKALDLDPDFGLAHRYLMEAYAEKGMFREAIEEFTKGGYSEGATAEGTAQLQQAYTQGVRRVTGGSASTWHSKGRSMVIFRQAEWHCFLRAWVRRTKRLNGWKEQSPSMMRGCFG